jgi:arsenate reductase-like glutaredoxin family protein
MNAEQALTAPELKYTDRDVREDPTLRELAEAWAQSYGGEFEPLVNAKREYWREGQLSTTTARTVLNCMRNDVNGFRLLRAPRPVVLELVGGRVTGKLGQPPFCSDPRPHYAHTEYQGRRAQRCAGVPWEINRASYFRTTARIKARYAAAANSPMYHLTSGKGELVWRTDDEHAYGMARPSELWVDLVCRYPSVLKDPMLFLQEPTHLTSTVKLDMGKPRKLCRYCAAERS